MSDNVAIAISAAANVSAALAIQRAREAECKVLMGTYDAHAATIEAKRDYAGCVHTLYGTGEPLTGEEAIWLKIAIIVALLVGAGGAVWGWNEDGPMCAGLMFVVWPFFGAIIVGILALVVYSIC